MNINETNFDFNWMTENASFITSNQKNNNNNKAQIRDVVMLLQPFSHGYIFTLYIFK